jgi:photosynthetic reaction center H subunit
MIMSADFLEYDIAFISLILFFMFFLGLVIYLRREDRREGYPLEEDGNASVLRNPGGFLFFPDPKTFRLPHGGTATVPNEKRDSRPIAAKRSVVSGSPLEPTGNPMLDGVGPAAWAERANVPDLTHHGKPKIVPMRVVSDVKIADGDSDPRGMSVVGTDGAEAGTVSDVWVDVPESMVRYLEVTVKANGSKVLLPITMAVIHGSKRVVEVDAITSSQFASVPKIANPDQVTLLEEERVVAYYGGGYLYATPSRTEPII